MDHPNTFDFLQLTIEETGIALLSVNRPSKLNALNKSVLDEFEAAFSNLHQDKNVRAVIVTGAGEKAFVAGADISELRGLSKKKGRKLSRQGQGVFRLIEEMPKPVVAVINGYALGGGLELALACHLRIAEPQAVMGLPETSLGLIPGYGGTQRLTRTVGKAKALEMILTGNFVKAEEANQIGLINTVTEEGQAMAKAKKLVTSILENGPLAIAQAIKSVQMAEGEIDEGYRFEADAFGKLCETEDAKEGTTAFLEKRTAQFTGN